MDGFNTFGRGDARGESPQRFSSVSLPRIDHNAAWVERPVRALGEGVAWTTADGVPVVNADSDRLILASPDGLMMALAPPWRLHVPEAGPVFWNPGRLPFRLSSRRRHHDITVSMF